MFHRPAKKQIDRIMKTIDDAIETLSKKATEQEDLDLLLDLMEKRSQLEREKVKLRRVSPDTIAVIIGNLVGIAVIIGHEKIGNVITSKALGFVLRGRV